MKLVVIGGGIIGLTTAYYAAKSGIEVIVLERDDTSDKGCSTGNAGMIVPSHFTPLAAPGMVQMGLKMLLNSESPFGINFTDMKTLKWAYHFARNCTNKNVSRSAETLAQLGLLSKLEFEKITEDIGDIGLIKKGLLMLCKTRKAFEEECEVVAHAHRLGIPAQVLNAEELAKLEPQIVMNVHGAVHFVDDACLDPGLLIKMLTTKLENSGVKLIYNQEVKNWKEISNKIVAVETRDSEFEADHFVITTGVWSSFLASKLNINIPVVAGKGYSLTLPNPVELPQICSILVEARLAITPIGTSLRAAGTMEIGANNYRINENRVNGIKKSLPEYFPKFKSSDFDDLPVWGGLRPCSPDGLPIIGKISRFSNLSIGTGHAMVGLSLGPITGKLLVEDLLRPEDNLIPTILNPSRFN